MENGVELSLDQMAGLDGGMSCGAAGAILVGTIVLGAFVSVTTWGALASAAFSFGAAVYGVYDSCPK